MIALASFASHRAFPGLLYCSWAARSLSPAVPFDAMAAAKQVELTVAK
jgi:hypothetical protein